MKFIRAFIFLTAAIVVRADTVQVVEIDIQGKPYVTGSTTTSTTKLPDGNEQTKVSTSRLNSDGKLVLDTTATIVTTPVVGGVSTTTSTERRIDVNGNAQPDRQVVDRTTKVGKNEIQNERTIQSVNHLNGNLAVTGRELSTTRIDGNKSTTETTLQKPTSTGWRLEGQVRTIETKAANGSIQREIIESGRSGFDRAGSSSGLGDSLQPQRKIIEREVPQADGNKIVERQTFRRDVNGDWKPASFSTENGQKHIQ